MGFMDALCARIDGVLQRQWWYPAEAADEFRAPAVHAQYLPVSKTEATDRDKTKDYPLVQVVCTSGEIAGFGEVTHGSEIRHEIYFGGYSNDTDNQGWRIPMAMLWHVMQDLLANTIINGYRLDTPVRWTPLNSREPPYYTAKLETIWKGRPPAIESPDESVGIR